MKTNEIKKGMRVKLSASASMGEMPRWEGEMWDNMRGNTRVVNVEGFFTEAGSVYSHDIIACKPTPDSEWIPIEYTKSQIDCKNRVAEMGW